MLRVKKSLATLAIAMTLLVSVSVSAIESLQLTDVIKSNGTGNINFFKDLNADQLEQYRVDNNGFIVLAVDVNEAASGTEKASSQAVTLKSAVLTIGYDDGSEVIYDSANGCCFSETQTLVAETPGTTRETYYTFLGESGSSRITANNTVQDAFDSTFKIETPVKIHDPNGPSAVSADLQIMLLETNTAMGDPEAFYDYSAGFEDLAMLNSIDAAFIDDYAAGRDEAPMLILTNPPEVVDPMAITNWNYFPSASSFYVVGYEDLYPAKGDYDFNDLTVAYRVQYGLNADNDVIAIQGLAYLVTRGSAYSHDWRLSIGLQGNVGGSLSCTTYTDYRDPTQTQSCSPDNNSTTAGDINLTLFDDTLIIFPDPAGSLFVNTQELGTAPWYLKFFNGPKSEFRVDLDSPVQFASLQAAPFDPYLYVLDTGRSVHLLEVDPSYQDSNGYPFGMLLTTGWKPPLEFTDTGVAYQFFNDFVSSEGASSLNWYNTPVGGYIVDLPASTQWAW